MNKLFWILWIAELLVAGWWISTELQLTYLKPNPLAFVSLVYLLLALGLRYGAGFFKLSLGMVLVPAIPLTMMGFLIVITMFSGGKWN